MFKNKFFYILSTLAVLFTVTPIVLYSMGVGFVFHDAVSVILTPIQKAFNYATEGFEGFAEYFYKFDELSEENRLLKEENSELRAELYEKSEMEKMYSWMSGYLDIKMRHTDFEFTAATVTGRESGNYSKILTLDVGSQAGIRVNMPVISTEGIVGQITDVGLNWSKVTTIVEANSSVGVYIESTGDSGVLKGVFDPENNGICDLVYLPEGAKAELRERVLTSGLGTVYPRGLVVGYIESVEKDPLTHGEKVTVKTAVNFSDLDNVMVVTNFETTAK